MAKQVKEPEIVPAEIEVKDFKEVSEPKADDLPKLRFGEVLVRDLAAGVNFITNEGTAEKYYTDEKKFKILKKSKK